MIDQDFQALIERSRIVEQKILEWYRENKDRKAHLALPPTKEKDLICSAVNDVEIKEDRMASTTGYYAFEFEDAGGNPSGLKATTAGEFVIVDSEFVIFFRTISLMFLLKECLEKKIIKMGYTTKDGKRALGYLVPRNHILSSPYAEVKKRWF